MSASEPQYDVITLTVPPEGDSSTIPADPPPARAPQADHEAPQPRPAATETGPLTADQARRLASLLEPGRSVLVWGGAAARQLAPLLPPNVSLTTIDQSEKQRPGRDEPLIKYVHAASGGRFDLVVIAGRARTACLHHAPNLLTDHGVVALLAPNEPKFDEPKALYGPIGWLPPQGDNVEPIWIGARAKAEGPIVERARTAAEASAPTSVQPNSSPAAADVQPVAAPEDTDDHPSDPEWNDESRALIRRMRLRLVDELARRLAGEGKRRVALFGAGRHTRPIVRRPWQWRGLEVVAILDDEPRVSEMSGVRVITPDALDTLPNRPDVVVISSQHYEDALYDSARLSLGAAGIPIERIYGASDERDKASLAGLALRLIEDHALSKDDAWWLLENRDERHDATLPMLPPERTELHLRRYELAAAYAEGARVLDAACGAGYGSALLARAGATRVIGVDADGRTTEYAERRHASDRTSFLVQDATALAFEPGSFDLVASFETIEHVPDPEALVAGFARVLEDDGRLVISTPNDMPLTKHHVHSFTRESFQTLLLERFGELEWLGQVAGDEPAQDHLPPGIFDEPSSPDPALPKPQFLIVVASRPRR